MNDPLRLVIFDVDGTLIDSQAHIVAAMNGAFEALDLTPPARADTLSIVGLSLPVAIDRLVPDLDAPTQDAIVAGYKQAFAALRVENGAALSPFYPGAQAVLQTLATRDDLLLGIATGKSRRGMDHLMDMHGIRPLFQTVQVADDHPSKPNPSMIHACLSETGVDSSHAVILGDTVFDIEMGRNAGIPAIGVRWGYHPAKKLVDAGAQVVLDRFDHLDAALNDIWGET